MKKIKRKKDNSKVITRVSILITFIAFFCYNSCNWAFDRFGNLDLNNIIFHMNVPLDGTDSSVIKEFIFDAILSSILSTVIVMVIFLYNQKYDFEINFQNKFQNYKFYLIETLKKGYIFVSLVFLVFMLNYVVEKFDLFNAISYYMIESDFIEKNYIEYEDGMLTFPDNDRNLIHIFLESVENTFLSVEQGGLIDECLMPNLYNYMQEYTAFSNKNGTSMHQISTTAWTVAGTVAQTAGIPFLVSVDRNEMGNYTNFFPGAYSIGDILETRGYNQVYFLGSEATFAGRDKYFTQHGNFEIKDYVYAKEQGLIDSNYRVWWGYEDSKLFTFAKDELLDLASKDEPFNFTMLTTNTHATAGYIDEGYVEYFDEQYSNVIFNSDKQVYEFIEWIMAQDFYENTTIVVTGDHLSMDNGYFEDFDTNYERTVFNLYINSVVESEYTTNREFYAMDIFPTTLASIGIEIEGNRLALGTNLFSGEKTLFEKFGIDYVTNELLYRSKYFTDNIVFGK